MGSQKILPLLSECPDSSVVGKGCAGTAGDSTARIGKNRRDSGSRRTASALSEEISSKNVTSNVIQTEAQSHREFAKLRNPKGNSMQPRRNLGFVGGSIRSRRTVKEWEADSTGESTVEQGVLSPGIKESICVYGVRIILELNHESGETFVVLANSIIETMFVTNCGRHAICFIRLAWQVPCLIARRRRRAKGRPVLEPVG